MTDSVVVILQVIKTFNMKGDLLPVGSVIHWCGEIESLPVNWEVADGRWASRAAYPTLSPLFEPVSRPSRLFHPIKRFKVWWHWDWYKEFQFPNMSIAFAADWGKGDVGEILK